MAQTGDYSVYEWDVEEVDTFSGDVLEHYFQKTAIDCVLQYKQKPSDDCHWEICIVLDTYDGRSWAYLDMETMKLPEWFEDASGKNVRKVPKRFHLEIDRAMNKSNA